ncbi:MAG TPA: redoxin domain-containing protein [Gemmataceae bacterium]|nr:redoxin domain-containing protein [Gemmataceae bacterium]
MHATSILLAALAVSAFAAAPAERKAPSGKPIPSFKLRDYRGAWHSLDDCKDKKFVVVAFLGTECPLANRYAGRLTELAKEFEPKGVAFLGIISNQQDSISKIADLVKEQKVTFPLLKDVGNTVADRFEASRTPEVFVLDGKRIVRYRGRIDDQFGIGYARPKPTRRDLAAALEELLEGKAVSQPVTEVEGCRIGRVKRPSSETTVTYTKHIAPLLRKHCVTCHHTGSLAPFALTSYGDAAGWSETIQEVIEDQRMPPWHANPKYGHFANDNRLAEEEKQLVYQWVKNGAPEGDPKDLPPAPPLVEGWRIKPDLVVVMPKPFTVPAEGTVPYQYFTVDPGFKEDKWVRASEAWPGNRAVVHHLVVVVERPGTKPIGPQNFPIDFLAGGAPGSPPMILPDGEAKFVPAGSKLVFQVHYTPNGTAQTDQSRVGLVFADPKAVRKEIRSEAAINFRFRIPPGSANHRVEADYRFGQDAILYSMFPHMHLRGKSFRFEAIYPDKKREILLDVPRYSFDWQNEYVLAEPKRMPEGTILHCTAIFDNSARNRSNPDPNAAVTFGDQTWEEMMVGYFDMALDDQDLRQGAPRIQPKGGGQYEVVFRYQAPAGTKAVYLAGSFNDWKPTGHKMDGPDAKGAFNTRLVLKAGNYEYKYVVEGKVWKSDPGNRRQVGFYNNSVLMVGERR